jgi:AcrR family transcriptional regulator
VAERAGVSIGSQYQYFADKEAIFQALQRRHRDQVMPLIEHALARLTEPSLDLVDGTVMLMRAMLELHREDLFDALTCMLRGLFAPWGRRRHG